MKKKTQNNKAEQKKERKPLQISTQWMRWMEVAIFTLIAGVVLVGMNSDYLFAIQERSLFVSTSLFFDEMNTTPGGIVRWAGCYLTQFFYYPILGASLLILLWIGIHFLTLKAFALPAKWGFLALIPIFALLCSIIDMGYWLYYHKIPGYWFAETLSLATALAAVWGGRQMNGWGRYLYLALWTALGYPLIGWYALLGSVLLALTYTFAMKEKSNLPGMVATAAGLIGVIPILWYYYYHQMRLEDAWIYGFPLFQVNPVESWLMSLPFIVITAACLLFVFIKRKEEDEGAHTLTVKWVAAGLITLIAGGACTWIANFDDENYHAELRMYRHAEEGNWKEVLKEARQHNAPTRQMIVMKNMALIHVGNIGNQMFHYANNGNLPHTRDGLKVHMAQTAAPLIYLYHAKWNYATRWAIENGVETGFKVADIKILAECALLNGELETAHKYISLLEKTTFHRKEAERLENLRQNPETIAQVEKYKCMRELHRHYGNDLDSDNGFCEVYLLHHFSNTMNIDSKLLQEVTLLYALVSKNIQLFWPRFFQYATLHKGEEMPIHYQEAAYMYGNLESSVNIKNMPFDRKKVVTRYMHFQNQVQAYIREGLTEKQTGEAVRERFGDTFWWYYFFSNNQNSY